jgi:MYXO-CTERM domain-containing protein
LFVINNTFVNDRKAGTFVAVQDGLAPILLRNNIFTGGGTITNQANADAAGTFEAGDPMFVDAAKYDYHLKTGSPCVDAGVAPGTVPEFNLTPELHYVHPASTQPRILVGTLDQGAFELGGEAGAGGAAGGGAAGAGGTASGGGGQRGARTAGASSAGAAGAPASGSAGSPAAGAAGSSPAAGGSSDDGGCGCRSVGGSGGTALGALLAAAALLLRRRRFGR